jgi:hypothetical protein
MSKSNKAIQTNETAQVETVETKLPDHVFNLPLDGTGSEQFIKDSGGVSKAIRILTADNWPRGVVAKMLNKRYQHVRNVLITPVKKTS